MWLGCCRMALQRWNPAVCGTTNLGGFWGWAEFDSGGLGDAELTGCGHLQGGPGGGASHFSVDITSWSVSPVTGDFVVSGTGTYAGHGGGSFPIVNMDTGIPAAPGALQHADAPGHASARGQLPDPGGPTPVVGVVAPSPIRTAPVVEREQPLPFRRERLLLHGVEVI